MELIDKVELINSLKLLAKFEDAIRSSVILGIIETVKRQKIVDAIPVVHGNWIDDSCSRCGFEISQKTRNYCPNCGAIMDGEHGN